MRTTGMNGNVLCRHLRDSDSDSEAGERRPIIADLAS
jgi:hypothetical protein